MTKEEAIEHGNALMRGLFDCRDAALALAAAARAISEQLEATEQSVLRLVEHIEEQAE